MIASYELAVIGAGPAGMEAALAAAAAGVETAVIDGHPAPGGQVYMPLPAGFEASRPAGEETEGERLSRRLDAAPLARLWNAAVWGIFPDESGSGWSIALAGAEVPRRIHARLLILATGAYDTPVAFPGWTLPGVLTCGAALTLLKNQRIAPFRRVLVSGTGPLVLSAAAHLSAAGVAVAGVCEANRFSRRALRHAPTLLRESRRLGEGAGYLSRLLLAGTPYRTGWSVVEASGEGRVEKAVIARLDAAGAPLPGSERNVEVDGVIAGYGLTPNRGLAQMVGCRLEYLPQKGGWAPWRGENLQTSLPGVYCAGDCAGIAGAENSRLEGQIAGTAAARELGKITAQQAEDFSRRVRPAWAQQQRFARALAELYPLPPGLVSLLQEDTPLCRCEEVTLGAVKQAVAAGAQTLGEVKMLTRAGMGNCQGRMCERPVTAVLLRELGAGAAPETTGSYSVRPPLHPVPIGSLLEDEDS